MHVRNPIGMDAPHAAVPGFIAPGVVIVFLLGFFDKRANAAGAYTALLGSVAANVVLKFATPDIPFIIRIWIVFILALVAAVVISRVTGKPDEEQTVRLGDTNNG